MKIKILIADDHSLMRVGLDALFSHQLLKAADRP